MTPAQVLEEAKKRFVVLYHKNEADLESLLRKALRTYQDKAGSLAVITISEEQGGGNIPLPLDFLDVCVAMDDRTTYHDCTIDRTTDPDNPTLKVAVRDDTEFPQQVFYFQRLDEWPLEEDLPKGMAGMLIDYLAALIDVPNTERERKVAASTGQQVELLSRQELEDRVRIIEEDIKNSRAIVVPTAVF